MFSIAAMWILFNMSFLNLSSVYLELAWSVRRSIFLWYFLEIKNNYQHYKNRDGTYALRPHGSEKHLNHTSHVCGKKQPNHYFSHAMNDATNTMFPILLYTFCCVVVLKGVMSLPRADSFSELCSPLLKGGNSAFTASMASGLFPQNEYRSLESLQPK